MSVNRTNLLKKICAVSLAAAMLAGAGLTEAGTYIGTAVQVGAVTSSSEETPASSFEYEENEDGSITITKYIGDETNVVIPSKIDGKAVTSIGECAFLSCISLEKIEIPDSVTNIKNWAFERCTSLKKVEIPNGVTSIGGWSFRGCTSLEKVEISNSVTSIGMNAFAKCTSLTEVTIPNRLTNIGDCIFEDCTSLKEVKIPDSVTRIGMAFYNCTNLTSIIVPNSVTSIDYGAFGYKKDLEKTEKISNFTIYGTKGSEAENYAITNDFMFIDVSELSEQKKSDGNTNVSVYGNIPKTAKLNVKSVSTDVKNAVLAYDITLTKDNKEIEPVGEVTVSIPCDTPDLIVVWLHDGEQTDMNAAYADGKYTFKVSHFSTYVLVKNGLLGDTNGDGKVNIADALMIARYDAKLTTLNDAQISVSDVNGDSKVNIADALKIARYDAKLIDSLD